MNCPHCGSDQIKAFTTVYFSGTVAKDMVEMTKVECQCCGLCAPAAKHKEDAKALFLNIVIRKPEDEQ